jgi:hypothetical protein
VRGQIGPPHAVQHLQQTILPQPFTARAGEDEIVDLRQLLEDGQRPRPKRRAMFLARLHAGAGDGP